MREVMEKIKNDIQEHGLHVMSVCGDDIQSFSYTIGLEETFKHPEIIMSGLDTKLMHALLNDIAKLIEGGEAYSDGDLSDQVLKNYPVKFVSVTNENAEAYLRAAGAYYDPASFRALQCVWPDSHGHFQRHSNNEQTILSVENA
ncbi:hypothetical protein VST7929_03077 [Vibrio stylophorae]|uniref:DUF4262 domain-containing protein n=1 Tax=Vibrio stylophorae TaxID=659351 RepID=A0ABM8ZYT2_9VIBR|nr:DUF4262 domain-containing protein [Vibrio stylophorae]CAH0535507.1 hypothetical protein VST7929_03077 [Vibrio stylophorae]